MTIDELSIKAWRPDAPDAEVSGRLGRTNSGRPNLTLHGPGSVLDGIQDELSEGGGRVHGRVVSYGRDTSVILRVSGDFTVFGPVPYTFDLPSDADSEVELTPTTVFFGAHCDETPQFTRSWMSFDLLPALLQGSRPSVEREWVSGQGPRLTVDLPEWKLETRTPGGRLTVTAGFSDHQTRRSVAVDQSVGMTFEANRPMALAAWVEDVVEPMRYLIALLVDRPPLVTDFNLTSREADNLLPVTVFHEGLAAVSESEAEEVIRTPQMVHLDDEDVDVAQLVTLWFENWTRYRDVVPLLLVDRWPERRSTAGLNFLSKIQAAEAFHRNAHRFDQQARSDVDHEQLMHEVLRSDVLSKREKDWVRGRVMWNEPTLRHRLGDLLKPLESQFGLVFGRDRLKPFIEAVVSTRNSLTHGLPSGADGADSVIQDDFGMFLHGELTALSVRAHILMELGVTAEDAAQRVTELEFAKWAIRNYQPYYHSVTIARSAGKSEGSKT